MPALGLRVVHIPDEEALDEDLEAQWAAVLGREGKLDVKTEVCACFFVLCRARGF